MHKWTETTLVQVMILCIQFTSALALELYLFCFKPLICLSAWSLEWKCCCFNKIIITDCTGSCHIDNFWCSKSRIFHQKDISPKWRYLFFSCPGGHLCGLFKEKNYYFLMSKLLQILFGHQVGFQQNCSWEYDTSKENLWTMKIFSNKNVWYLWCKWLVPHYYCLSSVWMTCLSIWSPVTQS